MGKWTTLHVIAFLSVAGLFLGIGRIADRPVAASEGQEPPDKITIMVPLGGNVFPKIYTHKEHVEGYEVACVVCHHIYDDANNVREDGLPRQKCVECHTADSLEVEKEVVPGFLLKELMSHESCRDCHGKSRM